MDDLFAIPSPDAPLVWGDAGQPVVLLLHDWFGRLPSIEAFGEALASDGYRVVAPDFYSGVATTNPQDAERLLTALDLGRALAEIDSAIADARDQGSARVGVVGFSMGGWLALLHAQGGEADAVVAYYATLSDEEHGIIPCPVLLQFAENDEWAPGSEPEAFIDRLRDDGTPVTEHTYLGTQHSFANTSIRERVDARAAQLAFHRTAMFLRDHLAE